MEIEKAKAHLALRPEFAPIIEATQLPELAPSGDVYHDLLDSIVSQQLSVKAAATIFNRFLDLFPEKYPHANILLKIEVDTLRGAGLSNQKANYLRNVAAFSLENDLEHRDWSLLSDEEIIAFLTQIKGVGKWTTEMILIFTLNRPDIFPIDDLGIQQGMAKLFGLSDLSGKNLKSKMIELAEPWRPHRTLASRYLWRWKDTS